jgi:hypothetical protein
MGAFLLSNNSHGSILKVATMTDRSSLQNETGLSIKHKPLLIVFTIAPFSKKSSFESYLYGFSKK